jgi:uncharacterized protein
MPMIRETIVTTVDDAGRCHIAPLGLIAADDDQWIIAPFRPSRTLDNLRQVPFAVASHVDDVRIFAGCLTGRDNWPLVATAGPVPRLEAAISHWELAVEGVTEDELRPRFLARMTAAVSHAPASGFNRAQAAVLELAILSTRLEMLPREKVARELEYLTIAITKTAGPHEEEAWGWLIGKVRAFYGGDP